MRVFHVVPEPAMQLVPMPPAAAAERAEVGCQVGDVVLGGEHDV